MPDPVRASARPRVALAGAARTCTCRRREDGLAPAGRRGCGTRRRSSCRPSWRVVGRTRSARQSTARPARSGGLLEAFDARLPFVLTDGQVAAGEQIAADLARPHPMQRLLQGEVGSGKTVVALRAMLQVVDAGGQAALLAPTSVLAAQHVRTLRALLGDLAEGGLLGGSEIGTRVALLTGRAERGRAAQQPAGRGERPGGDRRRDARAAVETRCSSRTSGSWSSTSSTSSASSSADALQAKAANAPHLLVTTATPIPRTVAMTVFGELEISELRRGPGRAQRHHDARRAGRQPAVDGPDVAPGARGGRRAAAGRSSCARGSTPTTTPTHEDDGDDLCLDDEPTTVGEAQAAAQRAAKRPLRAVLEVAETLRARRRGSAAPRSALLHGRMSGEEKDRAIADFASGTHARCSCRRRSSRSASTCPRRPSWSSSTPTCSVSRSCTSCAAGSGAGARPGICLLVVGRARGHRRGAAARGAGGDDRRVRARARRPRAAPRGRRARRGAVRRRGALRFLRVVSDGAVIDRARDDARGARRGRPGADRVAGAARRDRRAAGGRPRGVPRPDAERPGPRRAGAILRDTLAHVSKPVIRAQDLLVGYGGAPVCAPVTFTLAPGKVIALVGANGSGKSTVLRAVIGLLEPSGGTLQVFGSPVDERDVGVPHARWPACSTTTPTSRR